MTKLSFICFFLFNKLKTKPLKTGSKPKEKTVFEIIAEILGEEI